MTNILITGMTSGHTSHTTNSRCIGYAGLMQKALEAGGHTVTLANPSVAWDSDYFDAYDAVVVGLAPLGSLGSNRAYGALSAVETLFGSSKLKLFIDAPEPALIGSSIRSAYANPSSLYKSIFSRRVDFEVAQQPGNERRINRAVELLAEEIWPTTLYPKLPWQGSSWKLSLPFGAVDSLTGVNLDSHILLPSMITNKTGRHELWSADSSKSTWTSKVARGLVSPVVPLTGGISRSDSTIKIQLRQGSGVLISPYKRGGTWWTPTFAHAMATTTPIATDETSILIGDSWGHLAAGIEAMTPDERQDLAVAQRADYLRTILSADDATYHLSSIVNNIT